jgi:hypothetical protein
VGQLSRLAIRVKLLGFDSILWIAEVRWLAVSAFVDLRAVLVSFVSSAGAGFGHGRFA